MKARRRHELKENVLAHELGMLRNFFGKHGNWIAGAVAAAVIAILVVRYYNSRAETRYMEEKTAYEKLTRAEDIPEEKRVAGLRELAETAEDTVIAASSAVWAGDFCAEKFLSDLDKPTGEGARYRKRAEALYKLAISRNPERKLFVAKAYFGLGILEENSGNATAANEYYGRVVRTGNSRHPVVLEARQRMQRLKEGLVRPVRFATTRATQPATATAPSGDDEPTSPPAGSAGE